MNMYDMKSIYTGGKRRRAAKLLAFFIAMLMTFEPSMLVYGETDSDVNRPSDSVVEEVKESGAEGEDDHKADPETASDSEYQSDDGKNADSSQDPEDEPQEVNKEAVRKVLQNTADLEPSSQEEDDEQDEEEEITVTVRISNDTYPVSEGAPWEGLLLDTEVTVPSEYTMMEALHQACMDNGIRTVGTDSAYVSMIEDLWEFDGGSGGGWMGTLNDWFTNHGFSAVDIENGDVIEIMYTCDLGEDVGSSASNKDKRIKDISVSTGSLAPEFDPDFRSYNLMVPEGTGELAVYTTAMNRNYQVRSIVDGSEYKRGARIPVKDGTKITVKCGDKSWPSMNAYEKADTVEPVTYTITVFEGAYDFIAETTGTKCSIELDKEDGSYLAGEKVTATLIYDKDKYEVDEQTVRAYVGGSSRYIALDHDGGDTYSFTMPCNDVEIRAECVTRDDYPLKVDTDLTDLTIRFESDTDTYNRKNNVRFTLVPEEGKRVNDSSVSVYETESGEKISLTYEDINTYSFTMPDEDVTIRGAAEAIEKNVLLSYTLETRYGSVAKDFTDESRTSICVLPDMATEFDLSLALESTETLYTVRIKNINGAVQSFSETEMKNVSVGTKNVALLGEDVTVTVLTRDADGKTHTYTIRIKTRQGSLSEGAPDSLIVPYENQESILPYSRTLMTSGVQLYKVDYQTKVQNFKAKDASVKLAVFPNYEEEEGTLKIRCKYCTFRYVNDDSGDFPDQKGYYESETSISVKAGETLDVPVEIDYTSDSGEIVTKQYMYQITNARFTRQRFIVLTANGNPMTPTAFSVDDSGFKISDLEFSDGAIVLDLAPGEHFVNSMKIRKDFTVSDDLNRPISSETVTIETDTPEYKVTFSCPDANAVYTITEDNLGYTYVSKGKDKELFLPPGKYTIKALNDGSHLYSRAGFTVSGSDIKVSVNRPYLFDPEFVVNELDLLEEIQTFDAGDGTLQIYVPEYQLDGIVATPVVVGGDNVGMYMGPWSSTTDIRTYYVDRKQNDRTAYIQYEVYNRNDKGGGTFTTDVMELFVPAYDEAENDDAVMPPDVRLLSLKFGVENGAVVTGGQSYFSFTGYSQLYNGIPVTEGRYGIEISQLINGKYSMRYTMRYAATEDDEMQNVYTVPMYAGFVYKLGNDHECTVMGGRIQSEQLYIYPNISIVSSPQEAQIGYYEVTGWFEDEDGNRSQSSTVTVYQDGNPPRGIVNVNQTKGVYLTEQKDPEYTNEPVIFTVEAYDRGKGLHEKPYSFDGGRTWTSDNTFTLTETTRFDFNDIRVRDSVGNMCYGSGTGIDLTMFGIDEYPTSTDSTWFGGFTWDDGTYKEKYFYIDLDDPEMGVVTSFDKSSGEMTVTVKAADDISGLPQDAYSFDGGKTWQKNNVFKVQLGEYRGSMIRVRDKSGNIASYGDHVWTRDSFAGAGPVIRDVKVEYGSGQGKGADGRIWHDSATLTIEADPGDHKIHGYTFDGKVYRASDSMSFNTAKYIPAGTIGVTDEAGNTAVYDKDIDLTDIDSTAPVIEKSSIDKVNRAVRELYAHIAGHDTESGNVKYALSPVPIEELEQYHEDKLDLEWKDAGDFALSESLKKYGTLWFIHSADYLAHGRLAYYFMGNDASDLAFRLWIRDAVGNVSYTDLNTNAMFIDYQGPDISNVTTEYKYFDSTSGIVKVYVAATEPKYGSGLAKKAYSFDGGKTWQTSNSISIPIGASIAAGQIKVRDKFGNISTYDKVVKTTLQDVITRISNLDPKKTTKKDLSEIMKLYKELSDRERSKVYNWKDFLDFMGNRKDMDWDDDFGDIGEPDDGDSGDDQGDPSDQGDPDPSDGSDDGGSDGGGAGKQDGVPHDGKGSGSEGGTPDTSSAGGGAERETVSVSLSSSKTSSAPKAKASSGPSYREAEIDKIGGGLLSQGMVTIPELILLIIIVLGAYTYGACRRYRRYHMDI